MSQKTNQTPPTPEASANHTQACQEKKLEKPEEMQDEKYVLQIADLTTTLKHLQADFENYKKRAAREQEETKKGAAKGLIISLLPVLDTFELAINDIRQRDKQHDDTKETLKGIELVYAQLYSVLEKEGIAPIQSLSKRYNPAEHEALLSEPAKPEAGIKPDTVVEELQKGYTMHGRIIRLAKVKIVT